MSCLQGSHERNGMGSLGETLSEREREREGERESEREREGERESEREERERESSVMSRYYIFFTIIKFSHYTL